MFGKIWLCEGGIGMNVLLNAYLSPLYMLQPQEWPLHDGDSCELHWVKTSLHLSTAS